MRIPIYDPLGSPKGAVVGQVIDSTVKNGGPLHEATIRRTDGSKEKHLINPQDIATRLST